MNCGSCIYWHGKEFHFGRYAQCNKLSYMGNKARIDDPAYISAVTDGRFNPQTNVYFEAREDFCCSMWKENK